MLFYNCFDFINGEYEFVRPLQEPLKLKKRDLNVAVIYEPSLYFTLFYEKFIDKYSKFEIVKKLTRDKIEQYIEYYNIKSFYNPQIFMFDKRKKIPNAIQFLEKFDYIIPFEKLKEFIKFNNINLNIEYKIGKIIKPNKDKFLNKDYVLYNQSLHIYELIKANNYVKYKEISNYNGFIDILDKNTIGGWVIEKRTDKNFTVEIIKNDKVIKEVKADKLREGLKKMKIHPTGKCGFIVKFNEETFKKNDNIKVRIKDINFYLRFTNKLLEEWIV